jgi:hypothetical protein
MNGETGTIPVTISTGTQILQFDFAIGINCQRTDKAYEQWQLKTHAVIVSGYQRQLADYQDKLAQYQSAVKSHGCVRSGSGASPARPRVTAKFFHHRSRRAAGHRDRRGRQFRVMSSFGGMARYPLSTRSRLLVSRCVRAPARSSRQVIVEMDHAPARLSK